ncbi:hypothetical protein AVEN_147538-1 [Araneus ventricosus]|uniref:Uncharacterized protein n=1 Tax=Araneus ventricosus TaxID=182803 RepID=A0A4Y2QF76_ARAVE|nr:hypothetical protein AVEN_147538-1 [Araneus ventricosus]
MERHRQRTTAATTEGQHLVWEPELAVTQCIRRCSRCAPPEEKEVRITKSTENNIAIREFVLAVRPYGKRTSKVKRPAPLIDQH